MGLNAGRAMFMSWKDGEGPGFETLFYDAYPVMRDIIDVSFASGHQFKIVRTVAPKGEEFIDSFDKDDYVTKHVERTKLLKPSVSQPGNFKYSDPAKYSDGSFPKKRWVTKPRGNNIMSMDVEGYRLERRSNDGSYNVYIYPPGYFKNSSGDRWIGAYVTGLDMGTAGMALQFAKDKIRETVSQRRFESNVRNREIEKSTMDRMRELNPAFAARFEKKEPVDNLEPDFDQEIDSDEEENEEEVNENGT